MNRLGFYVSALSLAGCGFTFERPSEVLDRRVLAISVEPPELVADGSPLPATVKVSALVVDPGEGGAAIPYEWRSCLPVGLGGATASGGQGGPPGPPQEDLSTVVNDGRCDDAKDTNILGRGTGAWQEISALSFDMPVPVTLGVAAQQAGARGFAVPLYVNAQLRLASDIEGREPLYAFKRLVLSPDLPKGRPANKNPQLATLLFDGRPWTVDEPVVVSRSACTKEQKTTIANPMNAEETYETCSHVVTPAADPSQSESYQVVSFEGDVVDLKERLRFAWFADKGAFLRQNTSEEGQVVVIDRRDPISTEWREPKEGTGRVNFWVVVRDGRGGTSWERREIDLQP